MVVPLAAGGDVLLRRAGGRLQTDDEREDGRGQRGDVGETQEVAEHAVVDAAFAGQQMTGFVVAIDAGEGLFVGVTMERRREDGRQEYCQQQQ